MKNALRSLILALPVLLQLQINQAKAEVVNPDVSIVLALDTSGSMMNQGSPSHLAIQTKAVTTFLKSYSGTCVPVSVTIVPWGNQIGTIVSAVIESPNDAVLFSDNLPYQVTLGGTNHKLGLSTALQQFTDKDDTNILVYTTDEEGLHSEDLRPDVPHNVTVYGISLGEKRVGVYLEIKVLPDTKLHYHAENSFEFETVLHTVLQQITEEFCLF